MKVLLKLSMIAIVFIAIGMSCDKEENLYSSEENLTQQINNQEWVWFPWEYVMDVRFSRGSCATGPGVCFQNEGGDIWDYGINNGDPNNYVEEVSRAMELLMEGNNDPESGVVAYRLEENRLHLVFSRSLEENVLVVDESYRLRSDLARAFERENITLQPGEYAVDRSNFEHGEAYIDIR